MVMKVVGIVVDIDDMMVMKVVDIDDMMVMVMKVVAKETMWLSSSGGG